MRRKLTWAVLLGAVIVVTTLYAGKLLATPASGFTSTTIAKGQFGEFQAFNQFIPPVNGGNIWLSLQKTKGLSDGYVLNNVWQPGGTTGWHTHPGHTLVIVTAGALTAYQGDDPTCTGTVYTAGMSFVEAGDHVHIVRNEGTVQAQSVAVRLVPAGQPGRIDADDPGNCHF